MRGQDPNNTDTKRFWSKVDKKGPDECWNWIASITKSGYGKFYLNKSMGSHRAAWILTYGDIPKDKWILHKCDNKRCCNPIHLYIGNGADNTKDRCNRNPESFFINKRK